MSLSASTGPRNTSGSGPPSAGSISTWALRFDSGPRKYMVRPIVLTSRATAQGTSASATPAPWRTQQLQDTYCEDPRCRRSR
eukprot:9488979-Pyramimonas_sp.AAC.1